MHRADRIRCRKCGTINNTKRTACRNCGHIIKSKQNICRNIFLVCVSISTIMIVTSILLNTIGDVLSYEMQHTLQNITIHADITADAHEREFTNGEFTYPSISRCANAFFNKVLCKSF